MIDDNLLDYMRSGRIVLLLGAGASRGAKSPSGELIPNGRELGRKISAKFLEGKYADRDFKTICDFASSRKSVRELQEYIRSELEKYEPASFHELVPQFYWAGLATTNYDLIIEGAYKRRSTAAVQHLRPFRSDGDIPRDGFDSGELLYVKLHGCITEYQNVDPPLIATTEQILDHRDGRAAQFAQFLEWSKTRLIVFAGYAADDANLRTLIGQIIKEGDKRPRHYIVRPDIEGIEREYWEDRRFRALALSFEQFLEELDQKLPAGIRRLAKAGAVISKTTFTRHISVSGGAESPALLRYLATECDHVSAELKAEVHDPKRFYAGFDVGWSCVQESWDVVRRIGRTILSDHILRRADGAGPTLVVLKAHAGAGKSVIVRRLAWDAATSHDKLVFFIGRSGRLDVERVEEIFSLTNRTVYLVLDGAAQFADDIQAAMDKARRRKWPLVIVCAERISEWNIDCEALDEEVDQEYDLKYLSKYEIEQLLQKLEQHGALGYLASIPASDRPTHLAEKFGRQLLVALHEATKNANFREIVANEYNNIRPAEARLLYLDICALNRFGTPVRAGLIARVHGIGFDEFRDRFFKPLEQIVELRENHRIGDYTYEARHPLIADLVYTSSLITTDERFDNVMRIVGKLNPTYSYDQQVLFHLIRASTLDELFPDRRKGAAIYEIAAETFGRSAVLLHQWGLYEMHRAGEGSGLDRAQSLIEEALEHQPKNRAIQHSMAELALRRSRIAKSLTDREAYRDEATALAKTLVRYGSSSFPFHTMAKAAIDGVTDALAKLETQPDELSELAVDEAIKNAEDTLRKGLQRFPSDDRLLTAEAELGRALHNAPRALQALTKAFRVNPKSSLVARRLATVQKANGDIAGAINTLRIALDHNNGNEFLHFDMATCLREQGPDADQTDIEGILFHYARAFRQGDKNYEAQFWCARQYWIKGDYTSSRKIFDALKQARVPYALKNEARGILLNPEGQDVRFNGEVLSASEGYGFVKLYERPTTIYFAQPNQGDGQPFSKDGRVVFSMAFSLKGPQAFRMVNLLI